MTRKLLDTRKVYSSAIMLLIFGGVIHMVFLFDPEAGLASEPLAIHRILNTIGFSLLVLGVLSQTTTLIGVDFYEEGADRVRFAHYRNVITIKFIIFITGLACIISALLISPSAIVREEWGTFEIIRIGIGTIAGLVLVIQIILSLVKLIGNRADYLEVSRDGIRWYDNEVGAVMDFKLTDLVSIRTIYEDSPDTPDVEKFEVTDVSGKHFEINLFTMSLLPQGRKILEIFKNYFPEKTDIANS